MRGRVRAYMHERRHWLAHVRIGAMHASSHAQTYTYVCPVLAPSHAGQVFSNGPMFCHSRPAERLTSCTLQRGGRKTGQPSTHFNLRPERPTPAPCKLGTEGLANPAGPSCKGHDHPCRAAVMTEGGPQHSGRRSHDHPCCTAAMIQGGPLCSGHMVSIWHCL